MKIIKLKKAEFVYLMTSQFIPFNLKYLIRFYNKINDDNYILTISEENADLLRDLFGEQLQFSGFDEQYKLTEEGEILEDLIDKFF
jgi:hypothetical protein